MALIPQELRDALSKLLLTYGRDVILTWFAVIQRGHRAQTLKSLRDPNTLLFALVFLLYMDLLEKLFVLIRNPAYPIDGLMKSVASTYFFEYAAGGLIFWYAFKLLGGRAELTPSFAAFAFMTAYLPLAMGADTLHLPWLSVALLVPFLFTAFRALGTVHNLHHWRAAAAFGLGMAVYLPVASSAHSILKDLYQADAAPAAQVTVPPEAPR